MAAKSISPPRATAASRRARSWSTPCMAACARWARVSACSRKAMPLCWPSTRAVSRCRPAMAACRASCRQASRCALATVSLANRLPPTRTGPPGSNTACSRSRCGSMISSRNCRAIAAPPGLRARSGPFAPGGQLSAGRHGPHPGGAGSDLARQDQPRARLVDHGGSPVAQSKQ